MNSIEIRRARRGELDEVARVLTAAFEQYRPHAGALVTREYRETFERYLEDIADVESRMREAELFVAVEADRILGAAALYGPSALLTGTTLPRPDHPWPSEWASLRLMAVDPVHRRRGIGRMLSDARVERARELGAPVVALHTTAGFKVARGMYRSMGWRRAPEYDWHPMPEICAEAYVLALRNSVPVVGTAPYQGA